MERTYKSITELPEILEVSDGDKLLAHHQGRAYQADATLFHGNDATINGEPAIEIEAGENISLTQDGTTFTISADSTINTVKVNGTALSIVQKAVDILIAAGTANGTISVNGVDVSVTGLAAALTALSTLIGNDANKSARTIALEELAAQLIPQDAQAALDTLQEIAAWIQQHPDDAAAINAKLTLGTHEVDGNQVQYSTVKAYVEAVWQAMTGATASADGTAGYVPAPPSSGHNTKYLRADGTWAVPPDTTYTPASATPLVDGTAAVGTSEKYAREDHRHPTDTSRASTAVATTSANGLLSAADKAKLDLLSVPASGVSIPVTLTGQFLASFTSAAAGRPLRAAVQIEANRAGSGDPSPSNVRPISGWTGVKINRTGKNFLSFNSSLGTTVTRNGITAQINRDTGVVTLNGTADSGGADLWIFDRYYDTGSQEKLIKTGLSSQISGLFLVDSPSYSRTYTDRVTTNNIKGVYIHVDAGITLTNVQMSPMICASDSGSDFESSHGAACDFSFPSSAGTVYGGTLDAARGILTVTHRLLTFNGTENFTRINDTRVLFDIRDMPGKTNSGNVRFAGGTLCSHCVPGNNITGNAYYSTSVLVIDNTDTLFGVTLPTVEDWKSFLAQQYSSNTPLQILYPLASPVLYQLTPQQLSTLDGANNVFADCGPVTVTHWPGTGTPVEPGDDAAEVASLTAILQEIQSLKDAILDITT